MGHKRHTLAPCIILLALSLAQSVRAETLFDDFDRPDGPADGWTTAFGTWDLLDGQLHTIPDAAPGSWVWAGDPLINMTGDLVADVVFSFGLPPADAVGRHGGIMFFASVPTQRNDLDMNGYTIDWIDRPQDHGLRLSRFDAGVQTGLLVGTVDAEPPLVWRIEVAGDFIRIYGDDALIFEVIDATYRDGHFGFWGFQNQSELLIDELTIDYTPLFVKACSTASTIAGGAPLAVDFDASCSTSVNPIVSYTWTFGDGDSATGAQASHVYEFPDTYVMSLEVEDDAGNVATTTEVILVSETAVGFSDDFARADGPADGWTTHQGEWSLLNEELVTATAGEEPWIWTGDPPLVFPDNFEISLDYRYDIQPADTVGRHGGILFCGTVPTQRYDPAMKGYTLDWIDRVEDHGFRLIRIDGAGQQPLIAGGAQALVDPPERWSIQIDGEMIRVFGDGKQYIEVRDGTYRNGFFGAWAYLNGQSIAVDNVEVTSPELSACFDVLPGTVVPVGTSLSFDASCSDASGAAIESYSWDFGDDDTGTGENVEHAFDATGSYVVTLTVESSGGLTVATDRLIEAFETIEEFEADFSQDDGAPEGWTVVSGNWFVQDEELHTDVPIAPEAWIFAGDPAQQFVNTSTISFDLDFLNTPGDVVGRHGGVFFFAQKIASRFPPGSNSGYSIDWIDRTEDLGYRISVWNDGVETSLLAGTGDLDPDARWTIEVDAEAIRLVADGEVKAEVFDATYRTGYLGFWSYFNGQLIAIDNVVVEAESEVLLPQFVRGDADASGAINITDGIFILNFLFLGGEDPSCKDAADADDSNAINITDGIYVLNFLFLGGGDPLAPWPNCGSDPDDDAAVSCETSHESCGV